MCAPVPSLALQMFKDLFFREGYAYDHNFDWTLKNSNSQQRTDGSSSQRGGEPK